MHWVTIAYVASATIAAYQRGIVSRQHTTFRIFRQSFVHLLHGQDLYAYYPVEQGAARADLFKYSPPVALLYAPLSALPYFAGLLAWDVVNVLALLLALVRLYDDRRTAAIAGALLVPQVFATVQGSSSNALVAALMLAAFTAAQERHRVRWALATALGAAIKIFPAAAITFVVFDPRRGAWWRYLLTLAGVAVALAALPLLIVSPHTLALEYRSWGATLMTDAGDLTFGDSLMAAVRRLTGGTWPSWIVQLAGTVIVVLPLLRTGCRADPRFQRLYLVSLLVYVVLFNHQTETETFVIAATGAVIWLVDGPATLVRIVLVLLLLLGLKVWPATAVWVIMQWDLWRFGRSPSRQHERARPVEVDPALLDPVAHRG
jgi:hypothetical protein